MTDKLNGIRILEDLCKDTPQLREVVHPRIREVLESDVEKPFADDSDFLDNVLAYFLLRDVLNTAREKARQYAQEPNRIGNVR